MQPIALENIWNFKGHSDERFWCHQPIKIQKSGPGRFSTCPGLSGLKNSCSVPSILRPWAEFGNRSEMCASYMKRKYIWELHADKPCLFPVRGDLASWYTQSSNHLENVDTSQFCLFVISLNLICLKFNHGRICTNRSYCWSAGGSRSGE